MVRKAKLTFDLVKDKNFDTFVQLYCRAHVKADMNFESTSFIKSIWFESHIRMKNELLKKKRLRSKLARIVLFNHP